MGIYKELLIRKANGETLMLDDLSVDELKIMFIDELKSDYEIAKLFDVKESKVTYRRRKQGISIRNSIIDDFLLAKSDHAIEFNRKIKDQLMIKENIGMISKALTHFAFRNGPVEDMHAAPNNQLSEDDMKTLNKFMANRLAYVFQLIIEERWGELDILVRQTDYLYGSDWDEPEPDDGDTRKIIELMFKKHKRY